jgi:hypothetical protein
MNSQQSGRRQWVEFVVLGVIAILLLAGWVVLRAPSHAKSPAAMNSTPLPSIEASRQPGLLDSATAASANATPGPSVTPVPAASASGELTLTPDPNAPVFSQQEAMQVVSNFGIPFALGGAYQGQVVSLAASYGIGTFGHPGGPGQPWIGDVNIPLKGTSTVLDHIENRPMWILDYGNIVAYGSQATFNHAVYAVDIQTRSVLKIWFYQGS